MKRLKKEPLFLSILLILFVVLTLFVASGKLDTLDLFLFNILIKTKNKYLTMILYVITNIGSTIGVISVLFITMFIFIKHKVISDFKYVVSNVFIGIILMKSIKEIIVRVRPEWKWIVQGGYSYPSGHTISAILLYGTLILLVCKKVKGSLRKPLLICFSIMMILIPISRIYFGVHYFTDVLGSVILGSIILIISNNLMNKEFLNDKDKVK